MTDDYEFVIVGGGSAGCVLAARLSADPGTRVLLIEDGGADRQPAMVNPASWPQLLGTEADWQFTTIPQADAGPLPYPAGRGLGGSGSINAMAHVRGAAAIYDSWPAGWRFADLLPYFRRSEAVPQDRGPLRGTSGPLWAAPVPADKRHPVAEAFAQALTSAGHPATTDLSGEKQEGVCWPDLAIAGARVAPADVYLRPAMDRVNLTVRTGCRVTGLIMRRGRCTGIRVVESGIAETVRASGEVILCAGAIGTAHLLMNSGIGPAGHLVAAGVEVVADLPVGENLQDHPIVMRSYSSTGPLPSSAYNHGEMYASLRSPHAGQWPDLQLFPILLPLAGGGLRPPQRGYALTAAVIAPDSRGTVRLTSHDPLAPPAIDPGFLSDGRDTARLEAGLEMIRQAADAQPLAGLGTEVHPGPGGALRNYIRRTVSSYWHPCGTCGLGTVVEADLRVRGVDGLRVADASVFPVAPNAPLQATVLAVAERAADLLTR